MRIDENTVDENSGPGTVAGAGTGAVRRPGRRAAGRSDLGGTVAGRTAPTAPSDGAVSAPARAKAPAPKDRVPPYEMVKNAILSGELAPGQTLIETPIAEWCGVSRTPVREAFRRLEQDGLIHRKDAVLVVRERSPEDILDVYETRIVLEATAARVAAERRTDHDVRLLRLMLEQSRRIEAGDLAAMVDANQQFHRAIWRASRNESLVDALDRLNMHLGRYPETTLGYPGRWPTACTEHELLIDAIDARRPRKAYSLAEQHFSEARDIRLELFAKDSRL
jgi:DNA-binding GntR family transcriptional regulator